MIQPIKRKIRFTPAEITKPISEDSPEPSFNYGDNKPQVLGEPESDIHKDINLGIPIIKVDLPHKHSERLGIYSHKKAEEGCVREIDKWVGWIYTEERILIMDGSQYQFGTLKDINKEPEEVSVDVLISALRSKNVSIHKTN